MLNAKCKMINHGAYLLLFIIYHLSLSVSYAQTLETTESRFLSGLRERRLFELAESYCRSQLAETYTARRRRAEFSIELSRTLLESALYAHPPERDMRFAAAATVLDGYRFEGGDDPWRIPLGVQRGINELVWGELLREEAQTLSAPDSALEPARTHLQTAITQLRRVRGEIDKQLQTASRPGAPTTKLDEPTAAEWAALLRNADYQLARAYRNQGESYTARSPDRATALDQALETLEPLVRAEMTDSIAWQARLDEVVCRRLLGDLDGAERMLNLIDEQKPETDVAERARAQRIRVRLNAGLVDEAQKFVRETDADPAATVAPDLRLAVLEWLLASSKDAAKAGRNEEASERQKLAGAMTRLIAERHSAYWSRRAETLMAAAISASPVGDAALLAKAAESLYQQGNAAGAIEVYDQAFAKALEGKQTDVAFAAAFTAAAIEQQRGRHLLAAERFLKLTETLPTHGRAAEAHLAGIFNFAQSLATLKNGDEVQAGFARYAALLSEHVAKWPQDATTAQARVWLGRLRQRQRDWPAAVAAFAGISPTSAAANDAVAGLADCFAAQFAAIHNSGQVVATNEAERVFASFAPGLPERVNDPQLPLARRAAKALAQLWLEFTDDRSARAATLLAQLAATTDLPEDERLGIETLLVAADVGAGRIPAASERIATLKAVPAGEGAIAAGALNRMIAQQPAAARTQIAPIVLRLFELRRLNEQQTGPSLAEAQALATVGRTAEARRVWETVAKAAPQDGDVQEAFAEFLLTLPDRESTVAAQTKWREVERAAGESSPRWYRARLGLARCYLKSGDKARAVQLLELTAALHPDLGGPTLKAQFEAIAAQCK